MRALQSMRGLVAFVFAAAVLLDTWSWSTARGAWLLVHLLVELPGEFRRPVELELPGEVRKVLRVLASVRELKVCRHLGRVWIPIPQ